MLLNSELINQFYNQSSKKKKCVIWSCDYFHQQHQFLQCDLFTKEIRRKYEKKNFPQIMEYFKLVILLYKLNLYNK